VDGTNWVSRILGPLYGAGVDYGLLDIAWGNGVWVAVGLGNKPIPGGHGNFLIILTSPDLITWTPQPAPQDADFLPAIVFTNEVFLAVGAGYDPTLAVTMQ
jgi:hypothetical protein